MEEIVTDLENPLRGEVNIEHIRTGGVELLVEREGLLGRSTS